MEAGNVYFARHEGVVVLKFVGEIRYTMGDSYRVSTALDAFLDRIFKAKDFDSILIDLTEAESIDSTNLGLLAKIARFSDQHLGKKATIVSTNEDINAILDSVGFDQVFLVVHESAGEGGEMEAVPEAPKPEKELAAMMLEAHRALMALSAENAEMFKNVVELLRKKTEGDS